jgi:hypothetical protein
MHLLYVCFNSDCNSNKFQFIFQLFGLAGRAFLYSYPRIMRTTLHESSISSLMKKGSKEIKPYEKLAKNFLSELKIPNSPNDKSANTSLFSGAQTVEFF